MNKAHSRILAFIAFVALQPAWGAGESSVSTAALTKTGGGIWFGQARVISGFGTGTMVDVPVRGMVAADGTGYFLLRNTVLRAYLSRLVPYTSVDGAPLVGAAVDHYIYWGGRLHVMTGSIQQQSLYLRWCPFPQIEDIICPGGWDWMSLTYSPLYESGSSLARIAGHYVDTLGQYTGVLTIAADGYVFMQDPATGCVVNGRVTMIKPAYSVYSIKLAYANCRSPTLKDATFTGLVSYNRSAKHIFALMQGTAGGTWAANRLAFRRQ